MKLILTSHLKHVSFPRNVVTGQHIDRRGSSWSWSYGSWIYNYLCNQCLSPLMLWVRTLLRRGVLDITVCDKVCQWLMVGQWFSLGTLVSSTNKTDCHDITEILLKVALKHHKPIIIFIGLSVVQLFIVVHDLNT